MFPIWPLIRLPGKAFVTWFLILTNVAVFYLELTSTNIEHLIRTFALFPAQFTFNNPSAWYTLVTYQFLHGGWFHIIANMWFLLVFGPNMERAWGSVRFLIYYLVSGIAAAALQLLFVHGSGAPMLGASGAIAGVLGAYFFYFPHHRIRSVLLLGFIPILLAVPAGIMLLYWFAIQLGSGLLGISEGVAFYAHVGGFMMGIIFASATHPRKQVKEFVAHL